METATLTNTGVYYNFTYGENADGGGISQTKGSLTLNNSYLFQNYTGGAIAQGGGIYMGSGGTMQVNEGNKFRYNYTSGYRASGGAIYSKSSAVIITGSYFSKNSVNGIGSNGGAIAMDTGNLTVLRSDFAENATTGGVPNSAAVGNSGGALFMSNGIVRFTASTLRQNTVTGDGGGAYVDFGNLTVINSTISGNTATGEFSTGGGLALRGASLALDSSTVAFNSTGAAFGAGGLSTSTSSSVNINNSIVAKNTGGYAPDVPMPVQLAIIPTLTVRNSLIGDNQGSGLAASPSPNGQGNIIGTHATPIDPLLKPLSGAEGGTPSHALKNNSPVLNRGSNARADILRLTVDQTGRERFVGSAIDMGAYELQGPSVDTIVRAAGSVNPTSAASVSFKITFNEAVSGVTASQFSATVTDSVQTGTITVTPINNRNYTVTVSIVSGLGEVGLHFQSHGTVTSNGTNLPMSSNTSFDSTETFTIEEAPVLFVQSIDFAPGGTSPTTASTVSFKVTFSSAVSNVAASQFTVVKTGNVATTGLQLTGSGQNYTVTVNGLTGGGTLRLDFQNDGTVVRTSDGQVMTQANFNTGAVYEIVQGNQGVADLDAGGLRFHVVGGGTFTTAGGLNSFTGQVQVGFVPSGPNPFTPLAELNGSISVNTTSLSFSTTGAIKAVIDGTPRTLFNDGLSNISISELINSRISAGGGSSLTVAGVVFTLNSFGFSTPSDPKVTFQGSIALPKGIAIAVNGNNFVQINSSGISLSGASFSITNSFSVAGVSFSADQLAVNYSSNGNVFRLTGTAAVTVEDIGNLSVTFGNTGLVINNGIFSSIDVTVNGEFNVKGVKVTADDLRLTYVESTGQFNMTGGAGVEISGFDSFIEVTFGNTGLVITNGQLESLDMTVTGQISVADVEIATQSLRITYSADQFTLSGTASVAIDGLGNLSVTFGDDQTPGMVVNNGSLTRLDMTIDADFEVGRVTVTADALRFTYDAAEDSFTITGTAGVIVAGLPGSRGDNALSATFGYEGLPGLVVTNGVLERLDVTINATFEVKKVSIKADNLRFTYEATQSGYIFRMSGAATVIVNGIEGTGQDKSFTVTFGYYGAPGIVIENGALRSLDITVDATFKVAKVQVVASGLRFTYDASTETFTFSGTVAITIGNFGTNLSVTFGYWDANNVQQPGLVITEGVLERLDMTVAAGFRVGALQVNVRNLRFTYTRSSNTFTLGGTVSISPVGLGDLANISATFGDGSRPGLVITDGNLVELNFRVDTSIRVSALTVSGQLSVNYTRANDTIIISGTGTIALAGIGSLNVRLGDPAVGTQGLVIASGRITRFDMTITTNLSLAGLTLNGQLYMNYSSSTGVFTATGSVSVNIGSIGNVTATLGGNGTRGLVITNGSLTSLDMSASANFSVGPLGLNGTVTMSYQSANRRFVMFGTASGSFLGQSLFTVDMGSSNSAGLVIYNGSLQNLSIRLTGTFTILGVRVGNVSLNATYEASRGRFFFSGNASIDLPDFIPDWLASILGGRTVASIGVELNVINNNNHDSYVQAKATIAGIEFGFKKQFDGTLTFVGNPALVAISNGVVTVVNTVKDAVVDGWNWLWSWTGPLEGATVYYDPAFAFDFANNLQAVSGADGRFAPVVPDGATTGQLVVVGGLDRSTGIVNPLRLTAPYNAKVVSPLTSLVNLLMQQRGLSVTDAMVVINQALGIPLSTNLVGQSLAFEATGGDAQSAHSFSREVQVGTVVHEICSLLSTRPGAPSVAAMSTNCFAAITVMIGESGGAPLDLSDADVIRAIIDRTAESVGLTLDSNIAGMAGSVIADVNQRIDDLARTSTTTYLNQLLQIQTVAQGSIAPDLARLTAGQVSTTTFVNNYTGAALTGRINAATFGQLNIIGPAIAITPVVSQAVGVGQPSTFDFQVYFSSPTPSTVPVTVHYATRSQTATTANGDFDQTVGILTWQPGDTAPKTISVPVHATYNNLDSRIFTVELTDAQNAEIVNTFAIGHIESSHFATTTTIASSDTTANFSQSVTFTATVTNLDPALTVANAGTVTFYVGDQMLGSAAVQNGLAVYSTSSLPSGTNPIRAVYSGVILTAETYLPSQSSTLDEEVSQTSQSITFNSIPDVTFSQGPLVLNAFSTSGLPLTFRVISGAASLNGEVLTLEGAGTVVVEADQPGDTNFKSATPVTRTFAVIDSGTGVDTTAPVALDGSANANPGATVTGQLLASDADNDPLTYAIGFEPENGTVIINEDGSYEYTAFAVFEGVDTFTYFANDGQLISNFATITIIVGNPNLPPVVDAKTLTIAENSAATTTVGFAITTDPNPGQTLTFSITDGNVSGAFSIDAATGRITVANAATLDFEVTPVFALTIQVSDNGTPILSGSNTITINLTNVNEAPAILPATFSIAENSAASTSVGTVSGTDPDVGQSKTFSIISGNTGNAFAINSTTGAITVANSGPLNFEVTPTFNLVVQVTDNGSPSISRTAAITINLTNVNEAPVVTPMTFSIAENSASSTNVGTVSATDPDVGQLKTFSIIGGNTGGAFAINSITGAITVANAGSLDFETNSLFSLTIQATDDGFPVRSSSAVVTIEIINLPEQPVLAGGSAQATYTRNQPPVTLLPNITVQSGAGSASLGRIEISIFVPKRGILADYSIVVPGSLGSVVISGPTDFRKSSGTRTFSIDLNTGVTDAQVQQFLRSIRFNSKKMDPARNPLGRSLSVQVFDRQGASSGRIVTQIRAQRK
jgi:hypothetical protein